jgi:hypothetical protein
LNALEATDNHDEAFPSQNINRPLQLKISLLALLCLSYISLMEQNGHKAELYARRALQKLDQLVEFSKQSLVNEGIDITALRLVLGLCHSIPKGRSPVLQKPFMALRAIGKSTGKPILKHPFHHGLYECIG